MTQKKRARPHARDAHARSTTSVRRAVATWRCATPRDEEQWCAARSAPCSPLPLQIPEFVTARGKPKKLGVSEALESLGLTFEGTAHRGIEDARNIARIYQRLC